MVDCPLAGAAAECGTESVRARGPHALSEFGAPLPYGGKPCASAREEKVVPSTRLSLPASSIRAEHARLAS
jgi:hypothetical protein